MVRVIFARRAEQQIASIYTFVASHGGDDVALNFIQAIVAHCKGFDIFPQRGARRDDIRPGLRTVGFRKRVTIAFVVDADAVTIMGVYYGGQDFEHAFEETDEG